jgi:dTDP-4-amino-4,6-dideoxygalactose transaminase
MGVANGTDALVLALRLRGIGPGDEVITVSHSFVATASSIALVGARPVFVDVDERTMLMNPAAVERSIGPRTKAVMPVHLYGHVCDMDALTEVCTRKNLILIEDCAQALGARYRGRAAGTFGVGAGSLHPLKVLSACGDAGFVVLSRDQDVEVLRRMRNIGLVDRDHCAMVGPNSRLDTVQAAILLAKLTHLDAFLAARRAHAAAYRSALADCFVLPPSEDHVAPVWSGFVVRHPRRDALIEHLRARGIEAKIHYPIPIHRQEAFRYLGPCDLPVTDRVVSEIVSLPASPELSPAQRDRVIDALAEFH